MKKILSTLLIFLTAAAAFAASFNIDEKKDEDLKGIERIVFELKWPNCAICISTGNQSYSFTGGGTSGKLSLSLEGDLRSNNRKAVPSIITAREDGTLYVRLFRERNLFFGLVQSGSVHLEAELPEYFDGDITIKTSSGDSAAAGLNLKSFVLDSSSGDNEVRYIEAENITLELSSGDVLAENLAALDTIRIKSSSGNLTLNELLSENTDIKAGSGRINIERLRCTEDLTIHSSSGRITSEYLEGGSVSIDASSGKITVNELVGEEITVDASSGDITVGSLNAGSADFKASSGNTTVRTAAFNGNINVKSSSGDVTIELPEGTAFTADLEASSGKIRSDFRLLTEIYGERKNEIRGDANGGGPSVRVKASSGDITILER